MKRNSLTTAVVAGIAGTVGIANLATAVTLNPDGLGQVLIYPYYTVNVAKNQVEDPSNLTTAFSVVNTTNQGKAVKVRFLEGRNSREVRDFNLYLSPYDVWTATVFTLGTDAEPQANLTTTDTSCTVPKIRGAAAGSSSGAIGVLPNGQSYVRFSSALYSGDAIYGASGSPGRTLANTREGHFELIEMGVVGNNAGQNGGAAQNSIAAITHVPATGVPLNCDKVNAAWSSYPAPGYWTADNTVDLGPATGGLFGAASIVDGANGVLLPYSADAVDGFYSAGGFNHSNPGNTSPSLANVGFPAPSATAYVFRNGQVVTATYGTAPGTLPIDAFSALFTHDAIFNEYVLGGGAAATTDWAVTFPTKGFYVDRPYRLGSAGVARAPFVEVYNQGSRVEVQLTPFDREEQGPGACTGSDSQNPACDLCFSPCENPEELIPVLRYETQVISFQSTADFLDDRTSPVLGSALAENVDVRADGLNAGWLRIGLNPATEIHALPASAEGVTFFGLPITGFAATNYVNANAAPGKLSNYSGLWKHKGSRSCAGTATAACS